MRLSDLITADVVDAKGKRLVVTDVRLVQDGPMLGTFGAALRFEALVLSRHRLGAHMGLDRHEVRGPVLVKAFFAWLHRDARAVRWDHIRSIEPDLIRLRVAIDDLPIAERSSTERPARTRG